MAVSAAEWQWKQRALPKENGKYDDHKKRNAAYNRKYNEKKTNKFKNLLKEENSKPISEKRLEERLRQQKHREKLCQQCTPNINKQGYSSVQALSHVTNKVRKYLPYSPSKQRAVVRALANSLSMTENIIINCQTRSDSLSMETKQLVTEFYQQDDIRIAPGKHNTVTLITANGKEKLQKSNLYMHIKETYAVFKDKHPNAKIGISKFVSLGPSQVLLSSQVLFNVCTWIYHQNMILSLDAIHKYLPTIPTYNKEFSATCIISPKEELCWLS